MLVYSFKFKILISMFLILASSSIKASFLEQENLQKNFINLSTSNNFSNNEKLEKNTEQVSHILFLCTGNSCRSQIAEGWTNYLGKESIKAKSAGTKASEINPRTLRIMEEFGVDITGQSSKTVTSDMIDWANILITVCDDADDNCPVLPKKIHKIHWSIKDPAKAKGSDEEIMSQFRSACKEIQEHVSELLSNLKNNK